jgi:hypothetical protein
VLEIGDWRLETECWGCGSVDGGGGGDGMMDEVNEGGNKLGLYPPLVSLAGECQMEFVLLLFKIIYHCLFRCALLFVVRCFVY